MMSEELKQRIRVAITDQATADELIAIIDAQTAAIADQEARITALEPV